MLDVKHQHIVFTIPHKFRFLICKNFSIIKPLFNARFNVIIGSLNSVFKTTKKPPKKFLKLKKLINSYYNSYDGFYVKAKNTKGRFRDLQISLFIFMPQEILIKKIF